MSIAKTVSAVDHLPSLEPDPNSVVEQDSLGLDFDPETDSVDLTALRADYQAAARMEHEEALVQILEAFLKINSEPTDEQMHGLAESLGLQKEHVEQVIYSMLADRLNGSIDEYIDIDQDDLDAEDDDDSDDDDEPVEASAEEDEVVLDMTGIDDEVDASIVVNPINTDEMMSVDGEPDPYNNPL